MFLVLLIFSSYLFYPEIVMILCMCLCSFLFHTIMIEPGKKLLIATLLVIIHILRNPSIYLLILLSSLFLFIIILTIIITSRNKVQLSHRLKIIFSLGIGGVIVIGCIPYLARALRSLLSIGMYGLTSILSKGISGIYTGSEVDEKKEERLNKLTSSFGKGNDKVQYTEYTTNAYLYSGLILIILLLFTITIIYLIKRRKSLQLEVKGQRMGELKNQSNISTIERNKHSSVKIGPPSNIPVRMLVYNFEKKMKGDHKRKHGESFYEWLNRINLYSIELNSELSGIYEKARYGEEQIQKKDVKYFEEGLKKIKKQLNKKGNK